MQIIFYLIFTILGLSIGIFIGILFSKTKSAGVYAELDFLKKDIEKKEKEYAALNSKIELEFKNIANSILVDSNKKVQSESQDKKKNLLSPLQTKLGEFQNRLEQNMQNQTKDSTSLKEQIKHLTDLNKQIGDEAARLTNALKGEAKTRGDWGEMILERLLETSGLTKGEHYLTQKQFQNSKGMAIRPDVILLLPENRHLIVDSKVSLVAYDLIFSTDDEAERKLNRKAHVDSMRKHVDDLAKKDYTQIPELNCFDLVFMFVPIEQAFIEAVNERPSLYEEAFKQNVVIITPSTLLATLRLVQTIWQQENQNKNALQIAEAGGKLFDKISLYVESLEEVGTNIDRAKKSFSTAKKRLVEGNGNILSQANKLKELGSKTTKALLELTSEQEDES